MTIAWGGTLSKTHFDADTDDPSQARAELEAMVDRINTKLANQTLLQLSDKTGNDAGIVSGTAGTDGNLVQWNVDGDAVDGPDVLDEDDMASDSASGVASQQSIKAYVDGYRGAGLVPLAQATINNDAAVEFTGIFDDTYETYVFLLESLHPSADGRIDFRTSSDGGSTFDSGSSDYRNSINKEATSPSISLTPNFSIEGGNAFHTLSGTLVLHNPSATVRTLVSADVSFTDTSFELYRIDQAAERISADTVDAVQFTTNTSTLESGTIRVYGVKKS